MSNIVTLDRRLDTLGSCRDALRIPADEVIYTASAVANQADIGVVVYMNSASANTYTVNADSAMVEPFTRGQVLTVCQQGAGVTTLTPGAGVTFSGAAGLILNAQFAFAGLVYRGANLWYAFGNLKVS